MTPIPVPECPLGYPAEQIDQILEQGPAQQAFWDWMRGQTMVICNGCRYNHEAKAYEPTQCAGDPHGIVVYMPDFLRYMSGRRVVLD